MPPPTLPPKPPPPASSSSSTTTTTTKKTPHERAQAKTALRAEHQQLERAKAELIQLQAERRSVINVLKSVSTTHKQLIRSLEHIEAENERWQTPNANLAEMYRLRDEIAQAEKRVRDCHRRWDQLGDEVEQKHVEIAFGGNGGE